MPLITNAGFIFDVFKLALYIACAYLALAVYARRVHTSWLLALAARRFAVLALLTLLIIGIKVFYFWNINQVHFNGFTSTKISTNFKFLYNFF